MKEGKFSFKIDATSLSSKKTLAILPAYFDTLENEITQSGETPYAVSAVTPKYTSNSEISTAGFDADFAIDDGTVTTNLKVTAGIAKYSVRSFLRWLQSNTVFVHKIMIQSNDTAVFERNILFQRVAPSGNGRERIIRLEEHYSPQQFNDDKVIVDLRNNPLRFGFDSYMEMDVDTNEKLTFTFTWNVPE